MSTDRELLVLAAKAAGLPAWTWDYPEIRRLGHMVTRSMLKTPLDDDGAALRLAVKLDFCITQWRNHSEYPPHVMVGYKTGPKSGSNWIQEYEGDEMAANRRAIVFAAAEIGKAMP